MMDQVSIGRAFACFGADTAGRYRPLSATAEDGSLVLLCRSGGFSRPGIGVLRYTTELSAAKTSTPRLTALRTHLRDALSADTDIRLIIETVATGRLSGRIHVRPDLVGKVTGFDGDEYVVDFSRPPPPPPPPKSRRR
jgi:hypothetical protein